MSGYVLLDIGCAECRAFDHPPLISEVLSFATIEEAKAHAARIPWAADADWKPHPLGGEFYGFGSGDVWIAPVALFDKGVSPAEFAALYEEIVEVGTWARENGYQAAYDWIVGRFAGGAEERT